jgi:hypothetical protein
MAAALHAVVVVVTKAIRLTRSLACLHGIRQRVMPETRLHSMIGLAQRSPRRAMTLYCRQGQLTDQPAFVRVPAKTVRLFVRASGMRRVYD